MLLRLHLLPAAVPAFFAVLSLLLGTAALPCAAADTWQGMEAHTPSGNWVTTGSNVAATTFTQALPFDGVPLLSESQETNAQMSAHFLRMFPHQSMDSLSTARDGMTFGIVNEHDAYVSSTLNETSLSLGDGGAAAVVPEPGPMVTVVVLGFMTGVALLRGQSRVSAARLPISR